MASPSFPTTAPASGIFPAPAYATYHKPFPFLATPSAFPSPIPAQSDPIWPPVVSHPIHGNLHNSPFPLFYPYPPPAAAYMPMSGLSPNCPPPSPDPTPSTAPPTVSSFPASTFGALTTTGAPANSATPAAEPLRSHDQIPCSSLPANLSSPTPRLFDAIPTAPNQERRPSSTPCADPSYCKAACVSGTNKPPRATSPPTPTSTPCEDDSVFPNAFEFKASLKPRKALTANCSATYASCDPLSREFHKIHARLEQLQTCGRVSFETIQGEISGLSPENPRSSTHPEHDTISGLGASTKHPTTTANLGIKEQFPVNTNCLLSVPPPLACNVCPNAEVSSPAYSSASMAGNTKHPQGQPIHCGNLQVPTTIQDASSVFGEMPAQYGFHNLSRQIVIRADGTENSYYMLPEDYPLELASPEPVFDVYDDDMDGCSTEFLDVLTGTPEQLADEEEQHENIQALKCFRKPQFSVEKPTVGVFILTNEKSSSVTAPRSVAAQAAGLDVVLCSKTNSTANSESLLVHNVQLPWNLHDASHVFTEAHVCDVYEENNACLNIASNVRDLTLQLLEQDDERAGNCLVCKASNSFVSRSSQLIIAQSMRGCRLQWDSGAKTFSVLLLTAADTTKLQYNSLYVCIWDPGIGISSSMSHRSPSLTAATENPLPSSKTSEPTTWLSQVNSASYAWDPGTTLLLYTSIWLLVFRAEKAMVTTILEQCSFWFIKYYGVALWLIHFLPP